MQFVSTDKAPSAIGPYSQGVIANGLIYTSGQIGLKPNGELIGDGVEEQTHQVLQNLQNILEAAGAELTDVIKTTIFLDDMSDFGAINEIYASYFKEHRPVRSTVAVKTLPRNVKIEIDCIALAN
jgi:2-iminobutanoate/2-iminopropanoate deaminase